MLSHSVRRGRIVTLLCIILAAVTITNNIPASQAGSNDASGTVQVHATNVSIYNINIANTYGKVGGVRARSRPLSRVTAGV